METPVGGFPLIILYSLFNLTNNKRYIRITTNTFPFRDYLFRETALSAILNDYVIAFVLELGVCACVSELRDV